MKNKKENQKPILNFDNVEEIKRELNKQIQDIGDFYGLKLTDVKKKFNRYILRTDEEKIKSKKTILIMGLEYFYIKKASKFLITQRPI